MYIFEIKLYGYKDIGLYHISCIASDILC